MITETLVDMENNESNNIDNEIAEKMKKILYEDMEIVTLRGVVENSEKLLDNHEKMIEYTNERYKSEIKLKETILRYKCIEILEEIEKMDNIRDIKKVIKKKIKEITDKIAEDAGR